MKILYCAGNRAGSYYQLKRFLQSVNHKNYEIKIAAYKSSSGNLNIDYNLDSLLNFTNPKANIHFNGNYNYYAKEIKRYNPDLVISDMEIYSSIIAIDLNIKLWQYSPILLYYALHNDIKYNSKIYKNYSYLINYRNKNTDYNRYILNASNRKFVLSHLCDTKYDLIKESYEFVRPSFILGTNLHSYNNLSIFNYTNKDIINDISNVILFTSFYFEQYNNLTVKDINNEDDYKSSIENCKKFITDGTATFLADAFYNQKWSYCVPRYDDIESIICSYMNEYCKLGSISMYGDSVPFDIQINDDVKFISEYIEEI